jgi:hypothetical protein
MMARAVAISGLAALGLGGCSQGDRAADLPEGMRVVQTLRIDPSLVNLLVETGDAELAETLDEYAECVAAGYTLKQGFGFARHIRTNRSNTGGIWRADAVYSITPALPRGSRTMDAEVIAQNCAELGIPTS